MVSMLYVVCSLWLMSMMCNPTRGEATIYMAHCAPQNSDSVTMSNFNGKDSTCSSPKQKESISFTQIVEYSCKGEGKNGCKYARNKGGFNQCEGAVSDEDTLLILDYGSDVVEDKIELDGKNNCCQNIVSDSKCEELYNLCIEYDYCGRDCYEAILNGWDGSGYVSLTDWGSTILKYQHMLDYSLPLYESTWIGTHNSFANRDDSEFNGDYLNQPMSIKKQLRSGIRELTLDIHNSKKDCVPNTKEVRVCHNNVDIFGECSCGDLMGTGFERLSSVYKGIIEWLNEVDIRLNGRPNYETQVLQINMDLMPNTNDEQGRSKIKGVIDDVFNNGNDYIYRPTMDFGSIASTYALSDEDCVNLDTSITKQDILNAGKNIIFWSRTGCGSPLDDYIFDLGDDEDIIQDVNTVEKAYNNKNMFTRVKDGATKGKHEKIKLYKANIESYFFEGYLNIFELYGFTGGSDWSLPDENQYVIQPENAVWSWAQYEPNPNSGDCAKFSTNQKRFVATTCSSSAASIKYACYDSINDIWTLTTSMCPSFSVPKNPYQMNQLENLNEDCLVNYKKIQGIWTPDGIVSQAAGADGAPWLPQMKTNVNNNLSKYGFNAKTWLVGFITFITFALILSVYVCIFCQCFHGVNKKANGKKYGFVENKTINIDADTDSEVVAMINK